MEAVTLDASVLIGFLDPGDPQHAVAVAMIRAELDESRRLLTPASVYAEILVRPMSLGLADRVDAALQDLRVAVVSVDRAIARRAAAIRGQRQVRLPDALVLATAREHDSRLVTLDDGMRRAAEALDIRV
jgi:predicted nucleic acid-binding protein